MISDHRRRSHPSRDLHFKLPLVSISSGKWSGHTAAVSSETARIGSGRKRKQAGSHASEKRARDAAQLCSRGLRGDEVPGRGRALPGARGTEESSEERRLNDLGLFWRLGGDLSAFCEYIREINTRRGEELFKLKDNIDTRTNGYALAMNTFSLESRRRFPSTRAASGSDGGKPGFRKEPGPLQEGTGHGYLTP